MKALVLLSGGIDSATCLSIAVNKFGQSDVAALSIFYRQKHERELQSAKAVADFYEMAHYELNLSEVFKQSNCPLIIGSNREIEHKSYAEQLKTGKASTYVPFRNGLMLSAAASFVGSLFEDDFVEIYIGAHADDAAGNAYADCREDFIQALNAAIKIGTYEKIQLVAPFIGKSKADVVKIGLIYNLKISVGYLPHGKVIGLSKIARIADMTCRRLQLQERICSDIVDIMTKIIGADVIVYAEGEHSCMTARGIKKFGTTTKTLSYRGKFKNENYRREFFTLVRGQ